MRPRSPEAPAFDATQFPYHEQYATDDQGLREMVWRKPDGYTIGGDIVSDEEVGRRCRKAVETDKARDSVQTKAGADNTTAAAAAVAASAVAPVSAQEHMAAIEQAIIDVIDAGEPGFESATDTKKQVSHQARIGRSLSKAKRAAPGQEQYYLPHNLREDKLVYNRNPREGTKAAWLRKLYDQHLAPFIKSVAPGWAGTYEDFAVQIAVYESSNDDYCHEHTDKDDVDVQYMMCLGAYTGGKLRVRDGDGLRDVDLNHRLVRLDARRPHQVMPFDGRRISVIWYKVYDRTMSKKAEVTSTVETICSAPQAASHAPAPASATAIATAIAAAARIAQKPRRHRVRSVCRAGGRARSGRARSAGGARRGWRPFG